MSTTDIASAVNAAEEFTPEAESVIAQLGTLSIMDYENVRREKAKELGFRPSVVNKLVRVGHRE